jgi:hypothetical protein
MLRYWLNKIPQVADIEKRNFDKAAPNAAARARPPLAPAKNGCGFGGPDVAPRGSRLIRRSSREYDPDPDLAECGQIVAVRHVFVEIVAHRRSL